jgi:hypothetical protein
MSSLVSSRLAPWAVALLGAVVAANAQVYVEGVNDTLPPEPGWSATAGHEQAFRWTPQNSFDLIKIEFHSTPVSGGIIRLREDSGSTPGPVLGQAAYSSNSTGFSGASFANPYPVVAGQTYFVSMQAGNEYHEFLGEGGIHLTYYWTIGGTTNWNGPYTWAGNRMIKFYEPEAGGCVGDLNGDGYTDLADLGILLADFGCGPPGLCVGDLNGDGFTDLADLGILLADFGCAP